MAFWGDFQGLIGETGGGGLLKIVWHGEISFMNDPLGVIKKLLWKDLDIFWPLLVDIFIGISVLNGMKNTLNIVDIKYPYSLISSTQFKMIPYIIEMCNHQI